MTAVETVEHQGKGDDGVGLVEALSDSVVGGAASYRGVTTANNMILAPQDEQEHDSAITMTTTTANRVERDPAT
eukprot:SAG11_NODE_1382_length_5077_cov_15.913620_2_plen_74_part_00